MCACVWLSLRAEREGSLAIQPCHCCCCSVAQSCLTLCNPWTAAHQASLSFTISRSLLKLMCIESVMPSNISSSAAPFSSCFQYFPVSGSFPVSQLFASSGQSIGASASGSVLKHEHLEPVPCNKRSHKQ